MIINLVVGLASEPMGHKEIHDFNQGLTSPAKWLRSSSLNEQAKGTINKQQIC